MSPFVSEAPATNLEEEQTNGAGGVIGAVYVTRIDLPVRGNMSLFVPEAPATILEEQQTTGAGGVIGAVYVTRTERASVEGTPGPFKQLAKRVASLDEINAAIVRYLSQPAHSTSFQ